MGLITKPYDPRLEPESTFFEEDPWIFRVSLRSALTELAGYRERMTEEKVAGAIARVYGPAGSVVLYGDSREAALRVISLFRGEG